MHAASRLACIRFDAQSNAQHEFAYTVETERPSCLAMAWWGGVSSEVRSMSISDDLTDQVWIAADGTSLMYARRGVYAVRAHAVATAALVYEREMEVKAKNSEAITLCAILEWTNRVRVLVGRWDVAGQAC